MRAQKAKPGWRKVLALDFLIDWVGFSAAGVVVGLFVLLVALALGERACRAGVAKTLFFTADALRLTRIAVDAEGCDLEAAWSADAEIDMLSVRCARRWRFVARNRAEDKAISRWVGFQRWVSSSSVGLSRETDS